MTALLWSQGRSVTSAALAVCLSPLAHKYEQILRTPLSQASCGHPPLDVLAKPEPTLASLDARRREVGVATAVYAHSVPGGQTKNNRNALGVDQIVGIDSAGHQPPT